MPRIYLNLPVIFFIINGLCGIAFIWQFSLVLIDFLAPTLTNIVHYQRQLHEMDFPVIFKLCADPGFNQMKVTQMGYSVNI